MSFIVNRPDGRAGLPPDPHRRAGPHDPLQHRELRGAGQARRRALLTEPRVPHSCHGCLLARSPPDLARRATRAVRVLGREGAARPARRRADRPGAGEGPHPRHRRAAADRQAACRAGPAVAAAHAAHVLHRQPRHRQDHGGDAHGRGAQAARLRAQGPPGGGDARRPGRPVHRPHRAEDQEIIKKAMGGVLFIDEAYYLYRPENERDYGQEVDRDPAAGDGEPPRRPGGDPGRLQGPHGHLLRQQPRHGLAHRAPHRLPRLHRGRADADRAADAGQAELPLRRRRRAGLRALRAACAASSRTSPTHARSATRWTASACATPRGCSPPTSALSRERAVSRCTPQDILASRVFGATPTQGTAA